jgi:hypothetical protein
MNRNKSSWLGGLLGMLSLASACSGSVDKSDGDDSGGRGGHDPGGNGGALADAGAPPVPNPPAPQAGAGGLGASEAGAGGLGGDGPADTGGECTRTAACPVTCSASFGACLSGADGSAPVTVGGTAKLDVVFEATVTNVSRDAWTAHERDVGCFGTPGTERLRISLEDEDGKGWDLSLTPEQIGDERFAVGDKLSLDYRHNKLHLFATDERLIVRTGGQMELFFLKGATFLRAVIEDYYGADGVSAEDDSGLRFAVGDMTCAYSVPFGGGCSSAKFATLVSAGATVVRDPCAESVGDFQVTTDFIRAGQAPGSCGEREGGCDAMNKFFAAGIRRR